MKKCWSNPMRTQIARDPRLVLQEAWRNTRRKGRCKIKVKSAINAVIACHCGGAFGIFHEHHRAHGGNAAMSGTFCDSLRGIAISSPIIGVYNQSAQL